VVIDEIDKIISNKSKHSGDASAEGVQRDLLPIIEGTTVDVRRFGSVKTDYMLFIACGAFHEHKPSELLAELQGRLPIRVELKGLEAGDLERILTETRFSLLEQQRALLTSEGVGLTFTPEAIKEIARLAAEINRQVENIGARRLHTVIERIMEDISFGAPDMPPGSSITVDRDLVRAKLLPLLEKQDLSRFIL
jgi:ATP-dependent HslUV protease ATP-binding subunit HslU